MAAKSALNPRAISKNFYLRGYQFSKAYHRQEWALVLKCGSLRAGVAGQSVELGDITFKTADIAGQNDINVAKTQSFLGRLYRGVGGGVAFAASRPKRSKQQQYAKYADPESSRRQIYSFLARLQSPKLVPILAHYFLFLQPFSKSRQVAMRAGWLLPPRGERALQPRFFFSVLDLTPFAAGSGSFPLFYDYYDWHFAKLTANLVLGSKPGSALVLGSFFRLGTSA